MPILTSCACGAKFAAPSNLAGRKVACPKCKQPVRIPAAASTERAVASATAMIPTICKCGYEFKAKPELAAKKVACPKCKQPVRIPAAPAASAGADERIRVKCGCGYEIKAKSELAGRKVACPKCHADVRLPGEKKADGHRRIPASGEKIRFACKCGERISAKPELAGKRVACPKCKQAVLVPSVRSPSDKQNERPAAKQPAAAPSQDSLRASESNFGLSKAGGFGPMGSLSGLLNEAGFDAAEQSAAKCPSCKAVLAAGAVICVKCGFDVERGKQIKTKKFAGRGDS